MEKDNTQNFRKHLNNNYCNGNLGLLSLNNEQKNPGALQTRMLN